MEELDMNQSMQRPKRPAFLTTLCILSFVWIGFAVLSGFTSLVSGPSSEDEMLQMKVELAKSKNEMRSQGLDSFADIMEQLQGMTEDVNNNFYLATGLNVFITVLGLFSVLRMFKGYKLGFHLYIIYNLLSVAVMYIYVNPAHIPTFIVIFNLIFSALFIFLYSRNLHWLTK